MDLNILPSPFPSLGLRSSFDFRIVVKKKVAHRDLFVRKYGEATYATIVGSERPFIISGVPGRNGVMYIFIFV